MSFIRKVFWPAAIALGFLVFLGAIGGPISTISAADDSDFCEIVGPKVIAVDETVLYIGRLDRGENDDDDEYTVSLDNIIGNSKITSSLDGDDFDDYEKHNPTNMVQDLDGQPAFDIDEDLLDFLYAEFAQFKGLKSAADVFPFFGATDCGTRKDLEDDVREAILEAIDRGNACSPLTVTLACWPGGILPATVATAQAALVAAQSAATNASVAFSLVVNDGAGPSNDTCLANGADNPAVAGDATVACATAFNLVATTAAALVNAQQQLAIAIAATGTAEQLFNDYDIDCPTQTSCAIATAIISAAVTALVDEIVGGEDDCDDISDAVERATLNAGAAESIGAQFNDFIEDLCEARFEDLFSSMVVVDVTCLVPGNFDITFSDDDENDDSMSYHVVCLGEPSADSTITASPSSVEIVPALGNVSHSLILLTLLDDDGNQAGPGSEVDFTVDRCSIETAGVDTAAELTAARTLFRNFNGAVPASAANIEAGTSTNVAVDTSRTADSTVSFAIEDNTYAAAILGCSPIDAPGATPGVATITAIIQVEGQDIVETVRVTVVGPPFSMTISASPSTVRCGEKATIQVSVKDAIGQNVSDHTRLEAVTNAGGVLGGTGAVQGLAGPVVPISSTVAETFDGASTFYLLTSEQHSGPYEVVVTTGGAGSVTTGLGGVFSTRPVVIQTTVTCTLPVAAPAAPAAQPTITAPRTGQGTVTPPNTGDGGLADSSASLTLFAVVGMAAFAVAGLATLKFARR